jgi:cytochrome c-type biogenesis protein CcmH/NrfG
MSGRSPRHEPAPKRKGPSCFLIIFAAGLIIFLVLLSVASVLAPLPSGSQKDSASQDVPAMPQVTPGAAEAEMKARLDKDSHDVNAMVSLAELMANTGRSDEAIQWYEKAVNEKPDDPKIRIGFGQALTHAKHYLDAKIQLQKAQELDPKNAEPLFLLGQLYQQVQPPQPDDARKMFEQVIQVDPGSVFAQRAREQLDATPAASPPAPSP